MAILAGDIRLFKSQVMLDTTDGGGMITANEVVDGVENNMFPDISELDRTYGRVALRKVFAAVNTDNVDTYLGSHAIITKPPADPNVSVTLFSTEDWADVRTDARSRMESYLARGPRLSGQLLGTQLAGQKSIAMIFRLGRVYPDVGDALVLVNDEGLAGEKSQFIRITKRTITRQTYTVVWNSAMYTYDADLIIYEFGDALRDDYFGPDPLPYDNYPGVRAWARSTVVANAAVYYGITKLTEQVDLGDTTAKVGDIFTQLVPSGNVEVPLVDVEGATVLSSAIQSTVTGSDEVYATSTTLDAGDVVTLPGPIYPGSLTAVNGSTNFTDQAGELKDGSTAVATIDYRTGAIQFKDGSPSYSGTTTFTYKGAAYPNSAAFTNSSPVTVINRAYVWNYTFPEKPSPGAVMVSYRAQGRWYDLYDNGTGGLTNADSNIGSGTINYATGTASVTLGALPDVGSDILWYAGQANQGYRTISSPTNVTPYFEITPLPGKAIVPGTISITWNDGVARTVTDDGNGNLTGYASGKIDYSSGTVKVWATGFPNENTAINYTINTTNASTTQQGSATPSGSPRTINLGMINIIPGTIELYIPVSTSEVLPEVNGVAYAFPGKEYYRVLESIPSSTAGFTWIRTTDNGNGGLLYNGTVVSGATINYGTGIVTFGGTTITVMVEQPNFQGSTNFWSGYVTNTRTGTITTSTGTLHYCTGSIGNTPQTGSINLTTLKIDISSLGKLGSIVSGSVRFTWGGDKYYDRAGVVYKNHNIMTNTGTNVGTVNLNNGIISLSDWVAGTSRPSFTASVAQLSSLMVDKTHFRISSAPIINGSFQVNCDFAAQEYEWYAPFLTGSYPSGLSLKGSDYEHYALTAQTVAATADSNGIVSTPTQAAPGGDILVYPAITGTINYETGVAKLQAWCRVTGYTAGELTTIETNYPGSTVSGTNGYVRFPIKVNAADLTYNAVATQYIPLDADILGLDPVRLPQDGRVPIFQVGQVAVIHNTQVTSFPGAVALDVLNLGRQRIAALKVYDSAATPVTVDPSDYTVDMDAGTVTLTAGYVPGDYTTPIKVEHRIEDMALLADVQITGDLAFTRQISHTYPANTSYVSTALIMGDQTARVTNVFDQASWSNVWSDTQSGGSANGTFNDITYPITVENKDCIQERWAIVFTGSTTFNVIGENVGLIATGNTSTNLTPNNPNTGQPYFSLNALGWGAGWSSGNTLRFNTVAANFPIWVARTVQQGDASETQDYFQMQVRGDVDA
jgi:hypothetical protein